MSSFTRTNRVHYEWRRAVDLAFIYAYQLGYRFTVRGHRTQRDGWMWIVERQPTRWRVPTPDPGR